MENKEKNFMSAIVYIHNAESRMEKFLKMIIEVMEDNFEKSEIICVNDYSCDNSVDIIKRVSKDAACTTISILNMSYFHGLESAMNAGIDLSIGDFVLTFDSTVQDFDKKEIMNVYRKSLEGYDIVSASPNKKQKFTSKLFYRLFESFARLSYKMETENFRILSRRVINRTSSMNKYVPYRKAVYANCGLKTINLKYDIVREQSSGKIDRAEKKYRRGLAIDALMLFTDVGYKFSLAMTAIMMIAAVFVALYSIIIYFLSIPVAGWTTTILFLSVAFFGLFGILTIIIKYLQILVDLVFKRKKYSFESVEKLSK